MKKYFLLLLVSHLGLLAQTPYWNWAKINQTEYDETIIDTKFDSKGNFYVLGRFQLNLNIDNAAINCENGKAGYIAKYNINGELIWMKDINPIGKVLELYTLQVDNNDDVIIGGGVLIEEVPFYLDTFIPLTFDNNNFNLSIQTSGEHYSTYYQFIVKFNTNGVFKWVKNYLGLSKISSIVTDNTNNIFVTGNFSSDTLKIEDLVINKNTMYQGIPDGYIAKYNLNGDIIALKGFGGEIFDIPTTIKINKNNNLSIAGYFNSSTFSFDSETISNSNNNTDVFHLEIDTDLNFVSKYNIDNFDPSSNSGNDLSDIYLNSNNEIIVYGHFSADNYTYLDLNLSKTGLSDMFVTKYNNGNRLWKKQISYSNSNLFLDKIVEDKEANLFMATDFTAPTVTFNNTTLYNDCDFSTMIVKLDNSQNIKWIKGVNGNSEGNFPTSIQCHENNILVGGFVTSNSLTFDETTLNYNTNWPRSYVAMIKDNNSIDDQISIYPNPVTTEINILSSKKIFGKKYQIFNPLGKIITEKYIDNYSNTIDAKHLQSGIYFLKLEDFEAIKFIKN